MDNDRKSVLSQLRSPLVFFALSLMVVESAFGFFLVSGEKGLAHIALLSILMAVLFLATICIVAFLVYKVPSHIMLEAKQKKEMEHAQAMKAIEANKLKVLMGVHSQLSTVIQSTNFDSQGSVKESLDKVLVLLNEISESEVA